MTAPDGGVPVFGGILYEAGAPETDGDLGEIGVDCFLIRVGTVPPWMERVEGIGVHTDGSPFIAMGDKENWDIAMQRRGDSYLYRITPTPEAPR